MEQEQLDHGEQMGRVIQGAMERTVKNKKLAKTDADRVYLDARLEALQEMLKTNLALREADQRLKEQRGALRQHRNEGDEDMDDVTKKLVSKALWLDDLPPVKSKRGETRQRVLDAIQQLNRLFQTGQGNAVQVDTEVISYNNLNGMVNEMMKSKEIEENYRVFKQGDIVGITFRTPPSKNTLSK